MGSRAVTLLLHISLLKKWNNLTGLTELDSLKYCVLKYHKGTWHFRKGATNSTVEDLLEVLWLCLSTELQNAIKKLQQRHIRVVCNLALNIKFIKLSSP